MKKSILPCFAALATALMHAAPADDVKAAAKKLADAPSYAWTTTSETVGSQFNAGPAEGVTEKGGYTVTTRSFNGNSTQTVRKGDQSVSQNQEGNWLTREELMQQFANRGGSGGGNRGGAGDAKQGDANQGGNRGGGTRGGRGGGGFGFGGGGQNNPAEEVTALLAQAKNFKSADGAIVGDLSDEAVTQRLSFGGRGRGGQGGDAPPAPKNASGTVKFWLKDGAIAKYQVHVKGTTAGRNGEQERDTTTTVEIKDIGTAKVNVPDGAKKKLGA
ncbi:MAG TPA: hypothetical protein VM029_22745 [Opitutaceae bacterium]|nr:hypothetical protein [Opitutaceae bacterium]